MKQCCPRPGRIALLIATVPRSNAASRSLLIDGIFQPGMARCTQFRGTMVCVYVSYNVYMFFFFFGKSGRRYIVLVRLGV